MTQGAPMIADASGDQPPEPPAGRRKPPGPSVPSGGAEGGAWRALPNGLALEPFPLPRPTGAGSGEAAASPAGVQGAAPPGSARSNRSHPA